jgi:hypothetical protein
LRHSDPKVPGYLLKRCHDSAPAAYWKGVRYIEYRDWWAILNLTLYDEPNRKYV